MKKKLFLSFAVIFSSILVSCNKPTKKDVYTINKGTKVGLIDSVGNVLIEPQYMYIGKFSEECYAPVVLDTIHTYVNNELFEGLHCLMIKYGYVNYDGKFLFKEPSFVKYIMGFEDSHDVFYLNFLNNIGFYSGVSIAQDTTSGNFGYINTKGDTIIKADYVNAHPFYQDRAAVCKKGYNKLYNNWGIINTEGRDMCDFVFSSLESPINERTFGIIIHISEDKEFDIDGTLEKNKKGVKINKSKNFKIPKDGEPEIGWNQFLVDENGKIIKELGTAYSGTYYTKDNIAIAYPNELGVLFGIRPQYLKKNGEFIEPVNVNSLSENEAKRIASSKLFQGIIPSDNTFDDIRMFGEGYAPVCINGTWVFVDKRLIVRGKSNSKFEDAYPFKNGLAAVKQNGKWGYINKEFEVVIPCQYDSVGASGRNLCQVFSSQKDAPISIISYIDRKQKVVWQAVSNGFTEQKEIRSNIQGKWKNDYNYEYNGGDYSWLWCAICTIIATSVIFFYVRHRRIINDVTANQEEHIDSTSKETLDKEDSEELPIIDHTVFKSKEEILQNKVDDFVNQIVNLKGQ